MMNAADLWPEILVPYDARRNPLPAPTQDICDPDGYCIYIEQHWWTHISGQIARLLYRDAWEGTDDEIDRAIESISKILDVGRLTMGCGCGGSSLPFPTRIGENGQVQVSYDGGTTWQDAPQYDPRTNVTQLPPVTAGEGEDARCKAANSAVAYFQQIEADTHAKKLAGATIAQIAEAIIGFLVLVGIIATGGALAILGGALAAIAASVNASDFDAAFTSGVWADLLCAIYCNMSDDGSISDLQYQTILGKAKTDHPGVAGDFLAGAIQMAGKGGFVNASRLGLNAGLSCDSCECSCADAFGFETSGFSTVVSIDEETCTYVLASVPDVAHAGRHVIGFDFGAGCAVVEVISSTPPSDRNVSWLDCGGSSESTEGLYGTRSVAYLYLTNAVPFQATFRITAP